MEIWARCFSELGAVPASFKKCVSDSWTVLVTGQSHWSAWLVQLWLPVSAAWSCYSLSGESAHHRVLSKSATFELFGLYLYTLWSFISLGVDHLWIETNISSKLNCFFSHILKYPGCWVWVLMLIITMILLMMVWCNGDVFTHFYKLSAL